MVSKITWSKKRLILGAVVLLLILFIWKSKLHTCLTFQQVKHNTLWLADQVEHRYWRSVSLYLCMYIAVVVCGLPAVALMNIVGGFLFGVIPGVLYVVLAATTGGTLFFLMVRYIIGSYVQTRFEKKLHDFNRLWQEKDWLFLLLLRCIPLIPFFIVNILAGLTNVRATTFIWTTALGIIPTALIFTYAGKQLTNIQQMRDIFTLPIISALGLLVVIVLVPLLINRWRKIF